MPKQASQTPSKPAKHGKPPISAFGKQLVRTTPLNVIGRPEYAFDQTKADEICKRVRAGETIREITADEHLPAWSQICRWRELFPAFQAQYTRAREQSAESCEHNAIHAALAAKDKDSAAAARVHVQAWIWAAAIRSPSTHGNKAEMTINITNGLADRLEAAKRRIIEVEAEPQMALAAFEAAMTTLAAPPEPDKED